MDLADTNDDKVITITYAMLNGTETRIEVAYNTYLEDLKTLICEQLGMTARYRFPQDFLMLSEDGVEVPSNMPLQQMCSDDNLCLHLDAVIVSEPRRVILDYDDDSYDRTKTRWENHKINRRRPGYPPPPSGMSATQLAEYWGT